MKTILNTTSTARAFTKADWALYSGAESAEPQIFEVTSNYDGLAYSVILDDSLIQIHALGDNGYQSYSMDYGNRATADAVFHAIWQRCEGNQSLEQIVTDFSFEEI